MTYLQPILPVVLLCALAAGLAARKGRSRLARRLASAGTSLLFLASWPPTSALLSFSLEAGYNNPESYPDSSAQAIVVLSRNIYAPYPPWPERLVGQYTDLRCQHAIWLYQHWRKLPIVLSGGPPGAPMAVDMAAVVRAAGIPESDILTETRSTNTHENALFAIELLRRHGWSRVVLVTEACHMPRSERCFRQQGYTVFPSPCGFHARGQPWHWFSLIPDIRALQITEDSLHEWLALGAYRVRGWI